MAETEHLLARLNGGETRAEAWKPRAGEVLVGRVVDLDEIGGQFGSYPVVCVETRGGRRLSWHAQPTVARYELGNAAPEVGDWLAIRYDGKDPRRGYHLFRVVAEPRRIDWARYRKKASDGR